MKKAVCSHCGSDIHLTPEDVQAIFGSDPADLIKASKTVLDRLDAWYDGARIANIQCPSSEARNTMMNYAHLIDLLTPAIAKAEKEDPHAR